MIMNVAPISFCDKIAFNVRDEKYKTKLLEKIFKKYNIIVTDNSCQIYNKHYASLISKSKYLLSTNTKGNRYFVSAGSTTRGATNNLGDPLRAGLTGSRARLGARPDVPGSPGGGGCR